MKHFVNRIYKLFAFRTRAAQFGVRYIRNRSWQLPKRMWYQDRWLSLSSPGDSGSKTAFLDVFLGDVYGLRKHHEPVKTIVDIGAHVGFFSLYGRMRYPGAIIHAYEPNPALWRHLAFHANQANIHAQPSAVGLANGYVSLVLSDDSVLTQTRQDSSGKVKQIAIKDVVEAIDGRIDFLKLDCEGAEWDILQDKRALETVAAIAMEYHLMGRHTVEELTELLEYSGYRIGLLNRIHPSCGILWADRRKYN